MDVRPGRWRGRLLALLLGWVSVELLLLPLVAEHGPLRLRVRLPAPLRILGERSKAGLLPRDYVLVLGDSYAEGHGDWLTAALREPGSPPYQATQLLHEWSGRDVLSLGSGGADNVSSTTYVVSKRFAALWRFGLERPRDVLVYFYDGNDLDEDLTLARKRLGFAGPDYAAVSDEEIDRALARNAARGRREGAFGTLFLPYFVSDVLAGRSAGGLHGASKHQVELYDERPDPLPEENLIQVGGRWCRLGPEAQAPGLELTAEETRFALRLLAASLRWLRARFPEAGLHVVYLPAPLACYEPLAATIHVQSHQRRQRIFPAALAWSRTDELRREVGAIARATGCELVDATLPLREAARSELLHGPGDAKHFNRSGYTVLARVLRTALEGEAAHKPGLSVLPPAR